MWISKTYAAGESYAADQAKFEEVFTIANAPDRYLMVATGPLSKGTTVYARLEPGVAPVMAGYQPVDESDLPDEASLLVGSIDVFEECFDWPKP